MLFEQPLHVAFEILEIDEQHVMGRPVHALQKAVAAIVQAVQHVGKIIVVYKGKRLSLQYHKKKNETFYCDKGKCVLELGKRKYLFKKGQKFDIPSGTKHRVFAKFGSVRLLEVSTSYPDDVVRIADDYGRGK